MVFRQMLNLPNYGRRSAFDDLDSLLHNMTRLFGQVSGRPIWQAAAGVFPLVNITESMDQFFIRAEIPGMQSREIDISATGRNLAISGERKIVSEGENVRYHRSEREGGNFSRVIALPSDIEVEKIKARYTDGILTIAIPKTEAAKPKQITVNQKLS